MTWIILCVQQEGVLVGRWLHTMKMKMLTHPKWRIFHRSFMKNFGNISHENEISTRSPGVVGKLVNEHEINPSLKHYFFSKDFFKKHYTRSWIASHSEIESELHRVRRENMGSINSKYRKITNVTLTPSEFSSNQTMRSYSGKRLSIMIFALSLALSFDYKWFCHRISIFEVTHKRRHRDTWRWGKCINLTWIIFRIIQIIKIYVVLRKL